MIDRRHGEMKVHAYTLAGERKCCGWVYIVLYVTLLFSDSYLLCLLIYLCVCHLLPRPTEFFLSLFNRSLTHNKTHVLQGLVCVCVLNHKATSRLNCIFKSNNPCNIVCKISALKGLGRPMGLTAHFLPFLLAVPPPDPFPFAINCFPFHLFLHIIG